MGGCCSVLGCHHSQEGSGIAGKIVEEEYYTITVNAGGQSYRHVYLSTSNEQQQLLYGPPIGANQEPKNNYSCLFKLTTSGSGYKISNFVTHEANVFARVTPSGDIALDEEAHTEFNFQTLDVDTTISGQNKNGKTVMWYPTSGIIQTKVVNSIVDQPKQFRVKKALTTMELIPN